MDALKITLPTELEISAVTEFHHSLVAQLTHLAPQQQIIIDASEIQRIDTAGIQILAALVREASTQKNTLTWHNPSDELTTCAEHLGLSDMFVATNS